MTHSSEHISDMFSVESTSLGHFTFVLNEMLDVKYTCFTRNNRFLHGTVYVILICSVSILF